MNLFDYIRVRYHPLWRLRQTKWFRSLQRHCDVVVWKKFGNFQMALRLFRNVSFFLPHQSGEEQSADTYSRVMTGLEVAALFDVGANVGCYSWHGRMIRPQLELLLFEPDEVNLDLLRRTIQRNRFTKVEVFAGVVSEEEGECEFTVDEASGATGSILTGLEAGSFHEQYGSQRVRKVPATSLDSYAEREFAGPVFVKIDVEGAEGLVLKGARRFVARWRPVFLIECFDPRNLLPLAGLNYRTSSLGPCGNWLVFPQEIEARLASLGALSERVVPVEAFAANEVVVAPEATGR